MSRKPISEIVYWQDTEGNGAPQPFGLPTAQIVDERRGGVIAYCHEDTAPMLVAAIRAATFERDGDG